ncbi:hypothetical protein [Dactylosporangium sp. NPDC050588]|uniref:hypothetical protein n=1 Tax=Dactylosporangium sp. NPDC050588 TaxID=3157211 RepID=UPI0033DC6A64
MLRRGQRVEIDAADLVDVRGRAGDDLGLATTDDVVPAGHHRREPLAGHDGRGVLPRVVAEAGAAHASPLMERGDCRAEQQDGHADAVAGCPSSAVWARRSKENPRTGDEWPTGG